MEVLRLFSAICGRSDALLDDDTGDIYIVGEDTDQSCLAPNLVVASVVRRSIRSSTSLWQARSRAGSAGAGGLGA